MELVIVKMISGLPHVNTSVTIPYLLLRVAGVAALRTGRLFFGVNLIDGGAPEPVQSRRESNVHGLTSSLGWFRCAKLRVFARYLP